MNSRILLKLEKKTTLKTANELGKMRVKWISAVDPINAPLGGFSHAKQS